MGRMMAETTTDHETIRQWAEGKGGKPAAVDRTHQGAMSASSHHVPAAGAVGARELSRDLLGRVFEEFDEHDIALLYDEQSMFNKIVGRDTAERRERGERGASRR
jgi:hypothetical protein